MNEKITNKTKQTEACCKSSPFPPIIMVEISLGETVAFSCSGQSFTKVKPQAELAF